MKIAKVYMEEKSCWWYCTKCGHPHYFAIRPNGIYNLRGVLIAAKSFVKKGYFIAACDRMHMGIRVCRVRRKVDFSKAKFAPMIDKFCERMRDKHNDSLKREDKERYEKLEVTIREQVKKDFIAERKNRKEEKKQKKLFKKGKKKK